MDEKWISRIHVLCSNRGHGRVLRISRFDVMKLLEDVVGEQHGLVDVLGVRNGWRIQSLCI